MSQNSSINISRLKDKGQNGTHSYSAYVRNTIKTNGKSQFSCVAITFSMKFTRINPEGNLEYRVTIDHRVLLNEKGHHVQKPSKAQKMALMVAKLNYNLLFEVTKSHKIVRVINTEDIRTAWKDIKSHLLAFYTDLAEIVADFDWQLREENIQKIYLLDNFYQFFFSHVFYRDFEEGGFMEDKKTIANGLGHLDIPIIEKKHILKQNGPSKDTTVSVTAELDVKSKQFPQARMEVFLGSLASEDTEHELDFNYEGSYIVRPDFDLVTQGELTYNFEIKDHYKKTTTINFKLENDER